MIKPQNIHFLKIILVLLFTNTSLYAQEETTLEELPFDAVIQSTNRGKRVKFYGNTRLNFKRSAPAAFSFVEPPALSSNDESAAEVTSVSVISIPILYEGAPLYFSSNNVFS